MNPPLKILRMTSHVACAACLGLGFYATGQWGFLAAAVLLCLGCLSDLKWPSDWLPSLALVAAVGLAAVGTFTGAQALLTLMAAAFALAGWDLALLEHALAGNAPVAPTTGIVRRHFQSLAIVVGVGLLVTITSQGFRFQIPFVGMVVLVVLVLYSLVRLWRTLGE